jgi:hypothetical protein
VQAVANALGDPQGLVLPGARQQQDELVAAVARHDVVGAHLGAQVVGHAAQVVVAGLVPLEVVDPLEVVEVDDHARQRVLVAAGVGDLLAHAHLHRPVVHQPRQRVGARRLLELLVGLGVAAADDGQFAHRLEHAHVLLADLLRPGETDPQRAADLVVPGQRHDDGVLGHGAAGQLHAPGIRPDRPCGLRGQVGERLRQARRGVQRARGAEHGRREAMRSGGRAGRAWLGPGLEHGAPETYRRRLGPA